MENGSLPQSWEMAKLGDLGEINRGRSRHRPRYAQHLYGGPYPFIQTGDVKASGGRITSYQQTYSEAGLAQSRLWPAKTMCITIAANIAETGVLSFPACFPDSMVGFIADDSKCDVYFVEYMFRYLKRRIQHEASGSVQDNINLATLDRLYFPLPPLAEQRAIARILGTLDDKIELNRQTNQTLEAMASAIFKSWFVDFDPVRAKKEGRQPAYMDAATARLFPQEFEDSVLGEIPKGWEVKKLSELCSTQYGYTEKAAQEPIGPKFLRVMDINKQNWIEWDSVPYCTIDENKKPKYALQVGDIIVARMADPGKSAIIEEPVDAVFASYLVRLKAQSLSHAYYVYGFLKSRLYREYSEGVASGSVQKNMNAKVIVDADLVIPERKLLDKFLNQVLPLRKKLVANVEESQTLANIRDTLLPKLMSGEIRVKEAEKQIEINN